jgi:transglutaminase-like putative cysteine protease
VTAPAAALLAGTGRKVLLMVRHRTLLSYASPVIEAYSEVRKTPIDTGLQRVLTTQLTVDPPATLRSYTDYFGSRVFYFNLLDPHDSLQVTAESVVETTEAIACGHEAPPDSRPWPQRWSEFLHWSPSVPDLAQYREIPHGVRPELGADSFLAALRDVAGTLRSRFRYDPDATHVHSTPEDLFDGGGGVCQDFAHALIGVLRVAGVPARYASGYLYDPSQDPAAGSDSAGAGTPSVQGATASHAWVQAWHPELGWVGIDPTNKKLADWQYIRVAVGRDYSDVQPLRGVFVGSQEQSLAVDVKITRLGPTASA